MAELTKGYPFAFQVLGYLTWNHAGDYEAVIDEYNNRYHITYTLCSGLNSLQFYVTEIFVLILFLSHILKTTYRIY